VCVVLVKVSKKDPGIRERRGITEDSGEVEARRRCRERG
jgi:hypothetical protein